MPYYPQTPGIYPYTTATSVSTVVAYTTVNTTFLAANANRRGGMIYNNNNVNLLIKLGANIALGAPTLVIPAGGYYEVPYGWTGIIDGAWNASGNTGGAWVTELTA